MIDTTYTHATLAGIRWFFAECPACHGTGHARAANHDCRNCRGTGYIRTSQLRYEPKHNGRAPDFTRAE